MKDFIVSPLIHKLPAGKAVDFRLIDLNCPPGAETAINLTNDREKMHIGN